MLQSQPYQEPDEGFVMPKRSKIEPVNIELYEKAWSPGGAENKRKRGSKSTMTKRKRAKKGRK